MYCLVKNSIFFDLCLCKSPYILCNKYYMAEESGAFTCTASLEQHFLLFKSLQDFLNGINMRVTCLHDNGVPVIYETI